MKALQFSGGMDSLATLFLKRAEWDDILVMWCNTGMAYPETVEYMNRISFLVPHFEVVISDKAQWEFINGTGVDVVAANSTILGQSITGGLENPRFIDYLQCCAANIWYPLGEAVFRRGIKHVIRGQRSEERRKAPIKSGHIDHNGVIYEFPVQDWTKDKVRAYCRETCPEWFPPHYDTGEQTSHDCWDCVAYLDENQQRIKNLEGHMKVVVQNKLRNYRVSLQGPLEDLNGILTGRH